MTTAQLPTEFPTDKAILDALAAAKTIPDNFWVCRQSATGRGIRIHEGSTEELRVYSMTGYRTIREALAVELGLVNKPLGAGR